MSANRSRMTYGSPQYAPQEAAARNELFAGAPQVQQQLGGPGTAGGYGARGPVVKEDLQYMGNRQIMDYAVDQHKDTTATARRALQVVEQTKELQATTMTSLQDQGQQMRRVAAGMDKVGWCSRGGGPAGGRSEGAGRASRGGRTRDRRPRPSRIDCTYSIQPAPAWVVHDAMARTLRRRRCAPAAVLISSSLHAPHPHPTPHPQIGSDLTYSQRILRYMRMCCCVGFFCSSCVEPEREVEDRNWRAKWVSLGRACGGGG
jgi:hypothetical protein